jgi:hypothetical protein
MAVVTKDELLNSINEIVGEDSSDKVISLIENVTDTIDSLTEAAADSTDWKQKFEDNDNEWRAKYKARFFDSGDESIEDVEEVVEDEDEVEEKTTYEDLFEEED